jgi:hypothetical protein
MVRVCQELFSISKPVRNPLSAFVANKVLLVIDELMN